MKTLEDYWKMLIKKRKEFGGSTEVVQVFLQVTPKEILDVPLDAEYLSLYKQAEDTTSNKELDSLALGHAKSIEMRQRTGMGMN